ncbi:hypothetical protein Lesp02_81300 [Lentzea sp. NBRC 105346]|uniref:hypothetical protein n=1 Tax=Lentzea sp. NBRC 105346 TaxID=3032205 RepID=UPI0024A40543|nr:hypothetical protein [Lentzea sp. NBRC 105346]GLZ35943.1 hypothetical protein Lesp02_81300 [Lentzea sp. NBRC 105346]
MTIQLPPRRELPPEIKERMRPRLTQTRHRTWIGAAAAAALIVAGGIITVQTTRDDAEVPAPAQPAAKADIARCRTAFDNAGWRAKYALSFQARTVLLGTDGKICELGRSTATTVELGPATAVQTPSGLVMGVPPVRAKSMSARHTDPEKSLANWSPPTMITPDLFLVDASPNNVADSKLTLKFENHSVDLRWGDISRQGVPKDSFVSGDPNPASPVNVLARCLDNAIARRSSTGFEQDWRPGAMVRPGVLTAFNSKGEWGTCPIDPNGNAPASLDGTIAFGPIANHWAPLFHTEFSDGRFFLAGLVDSTVARVVLVSSDGAGTGQPAEIDHGSFAAVINLRAGTESKIRLYDINGTVVYDGPVKPA